MIGPIELLNEHESVARAMHDTGDLDVGGRRVRKVEASRLAVSPIAPTGLHEPWLRQRQ